MAPTRLGPSPSDGVRSSPDGPTIDAGVARLVWLTDRTGNPVLLTTDLVGGTSESYPVDLGPGVAAIRDARLVGNDVVLISEAQSASAELWVVSPVTEPAVLLDVVESFVVSGDQEVLAVRDEGPARSIWRVPTTGARPSIVATLPLPVGGPELGPFGFAISPDGRTVAAGWVGGPLAVVGPNPARFQDLGAPLVVDDDGRVVAVTGRAGEAYLVDGDRLEELAPADSDPVSVPYSGLVAWPTVGDDGALVAVEVHDLLAGTGETYPASGLATNVRELRGSYVLLEATAFDPLHRTVGVLDRRDGRFTTFEAAAPGG